MPFNHLISPRAPVLSFDTGRLFREFRTKLPTYSWDSIQTLLQVCLLPCQSAHRVFTGNKHVPGILAPAGSPEKGLGTIIPE